VIYFHNLLQLLPGASLICAGWVGSGHRLVELACFYQPNVVHGNTCPNSAGLHVASPEDNTHFSLDSVTEVQKLSLCPTVRATSKSARFFFAGTLYNSSLPGILTRYPWHQANLVPSQMPTAEEKLACQTRSDHQSTVAALHQSCSSEHSTSP